MAEETQAQAQAKEVVEVETQETPEAISPAVESKKEQEFSVDEQEILKMFKVKDADTKQLLGVIKRLNKERNELKSTIGAVEHEKKYNEFLTKSLEEKDWIGEEAKTKFEKLASKLDKSSETYWDDISEYMDIFTAAKQKELVDNTAKVETPVAVKEPAKEAAPAEKNSSKMFLQPQINPNATKLEPFDLIKKLAAGQQLTPDDFKKLK